MAAEPRTLGAERIVGTAKLSRFASMRLVKPIIQAGSPRKTTRTKTADEWQIDGWDLFDRLGVIKYPVQYKANVASKCRLYAATRMDPSAPPIPVDDDESTVPAELQSAALAQMEKLKGPIGGQGEIVRCAFVNLDIPGEFYLLGRDEKTLANDQAINGIQIIPESWQVRSVEEIKANTAEGWFQFVGSEDRQSLDSASLSRVWMPHPRKYELADSPMRALIEDGETLLAFKRLFRASAKSRLPAGLGLLPDTLSFGPPDPTRDGTGDGESQDDPFDQDLMDAVYRAIEEEGAPSSLAPIWLRGKAEELQHARVLDFGRKVDANDLKIVEAVTEWIAIGLDNPPELITGMGDVNHWGAWLIDDSSFRNHLEPKMVALCDALSTVFLQAELIKQGWDPAAVADVIVWYDPKGAILNPDLADRALQLRKVHAISDEYLREASQVPESAAPDDLELQRQIEADRTTVRVTEPGGGSGQGFAPPPAPVNAPAQQAPPIAAAVAPRRHISAAELVRIDRELRIGLEAHVQAAVHRAMERAGTKARNHNTTLRAAMAGVPSEQVLISVGHGALATHDLTALGLLSGEFAHLRQEWKARVARAQRAAYVAAASYTAARVTAPPDAQLEGWSDAGWDYLQTALEQRSASSLGARRGINIGGLVREALSIAGGAAIAAAGLAVAVGAGVLGALRDSGVTVVGYRCEWAEGDLGGIFEPHQALDGIEGDSEGDVAFGGYAPGDVDGCNCDLIPFLSVESGDTGPGGET